MLPSWSPCPCMCHSTHACASPCHTLLPDESLLSGRGGPRDVRRIPNCFSTASSGATWHLIGMHPNSVPSLYSSFPHAAKAFNTQGIACLNIWVSVARGGPPSALVLVFPISHGGRRSVAFACRIVVFTPHHQERMFPPHGNGFQPCIY